MHHQVNFITNNDVLLTGKDDVDNNNHFDDYNYVFLVKNYNAIGKKV